MKITKLLGLAILALSISLVSCSDGADGAPGLSGISCWDLNGNGKNDTNEDINEDGEYNALDCQGKNGDSGTAGNPGENGLACWDTDGDGTADTSEDINQDGEFNSLDCQGTDGADGQNGENGVGFDEMTQYGSITLTLSGTRPDGVAFEDINTFKFTGLDADNLEYNEFLINDNDVNNISYYFFIQKFLSAPDDVYSNTFLNFELEFNNIGEPSEEFLYGFLDISDYAVITEDNKYFQLDAFYTSGQNGASEFNISDLAFDLEDNNHLTFSFSFTVSNNANVTGHELTISGEVDVYLFEELN